MNLRGKVFCFGAALASYAVLPAPGAAESSPAYGYVFTPPASKGSPRIIKVELNAERLRAGGPIAIRVTTTRDVVKVTSGNGKRAGDLTKVAPGVFTSASTLPRLGGLMTLKISIHFEATAANGQSAALDVPVHYR